MIDENVVRFFIIPGFAIIIAAFISILRKNTTLSREQIGEKLSNPKSIEDVLMQCGAYGSGDSKYIADAIREWLSSQLPKEKEVELIDEDIYQKEIGWNECIKATKQALLGKETPCQVEKAR